MDTSQPQERNRPAAPRIPLVTEMGSDPELAEVMGKAMTVGGEPLNIFGALAHHPKLFKRFNLMGGFLLNKGLLPAREREIVILRVGWNAQAVYEFGQHTVIGRNVGLTDEEIAALASDSAGLSDGPDDGLNDGPNGDAETGHPWSDTDRDLIALADELCADDCVTDETFARLATRWNEAELVELVICAGFYRLVSGFLNTMGIPLDDGVPGFPSEPPGGSTA